MSITETGFIVLTYKRKILLRRLETKTITPNVNQWGFITCFSSQKRLRESTLIETVEKETNLVLPSLKLLFTHSKHSLYSADLTDTNVNNIKRHEGKLLSFFTLEEVKKLPLTRSSEELFLLASDLIKQSFSPVQHFNNYSLLR